MDKQTKEKIERDWHLFDAQGKILGRLAGQIACFLMGKDKPYFEKRLDAGDYVVVINAKKVAVSGRKEEQKIYYRHSGYPGGFKKRAFSQLKETNPLEIIYHAVKGMLPNNKLRRKMLKRLFVFADEKHPFFPKIKSLK